MIERITENEKRLDSILLSIKKLEDALNIFQDNRKNIYLISKYYGSKNWFKDKDAFEKNLIPKIKAGVLGEDTIWNTLSDIQDLMRKMQDIINDYNKKRNN